MVHSSARRLLPATLLAAALAAPAQPAAPRGPRAAKPDPQDAQASVPALAYTSSLAQYRRLGDEKLLPWREANDAVTGIGGWRTYAREARQPEAVPPAQLAKPAKPAEAATPSEAAQPMPQGHGGHQTP